MVWREYGAHIVLYVQILVSRGKRQYRPAGYPKLLHASERAIPAIRALHETVFGCNWLPKAAGLLTSS